ncbi:hypothetical protein HQ393_06885 [Chitinibacter bivalviorum]|uniref:Uncharacterized protein n=1 Tax=Chitinibacter bivalviorum TaxID=2739434 RepID=A0A7H9BIA6_9NEIS|nr:hypothetical protein [Chitinibacter bivalviorum]QLG88006.1 hypothetical protein HQ393_06885 [Chitinibacter bivalviorum]
MKKIVLVLISTFLASSAWAAKPKTAEEWQQCLTRVPAGTERNEGKAGVDYWIAKHCGETKPIDGALMPKGDCDRLFAILAECKEYKASELWDLSEASVGNVKNLLIKKQVTVFDEDCRKVGTGAPLPKRADFTQKYCKAQ